MYSIEFGLFPLMGIMVAAILYAVERWVLRLKCSARWTQLYIAAALLLTTACSLTALSTAVHHGSAALMTSSNVQRGTAAPTTGAAPMTGSTVQRGSAVPTTGAAPMTAPEVQRGPAVPTTGAAPALPHILPTLPSLWSSLRTLYLAGVAAVVLWLAAQLLVLYRYRQQQTKAGHRLYLTDAPAAPFSFAGDIFIPRSLDSDAMSYVLLHEKAHLTHRHFLKLTATQLLVALNWYNPFAWLLFGEMRLQQELEVDADVLHSGADREAYQLALLRVCVGQPGKWILMRSTFNHQPLKQRIIFMNSNITKASALRRFALATAITIVALSATLSAGCQTHEVKKSETRQHPMRGCWTMDWISNTGSGVEVHPVAMHYGFYNDSTFLCFSYWSRKGVNMRFAISGEGYSWRGDTLLDANDYPTDYTFTDKQTAVSRWMKDSTQMAGVSGPDITEQWHRIAPAADIVTVFRAAYEAKPEDSKPLSGVWLRETPASDGVRQAYCFVNDTIFMQLNWHPTTVARGFRYGGSGICGTLSQFSDFISQPDADHLVLSFNKDKPAETYRRIAMPPHLLRAFAPAAFINEL